MATATCRFFPRTTGAASAAPRITYSWKPEVLNANADLRAFEAHSAPGHNLLIISKGIHETY